MMSDSLRVACLSLLVLSLVSVAVDAAHEGVAEVSLSASVTQPAALVGEPLELHVSLRWLRPTEEIAVITSGAFLHLSATLAGEALEANPNRQENRLDSLTPWQQQPIRLSGDKPTWESTVRLDDVLELTRPGVYEISAEWVTTELSAVDRREVADAIRGEGENDALEFLEGLTASAKVTVRITCPSTSVDKEFFESVAGGSCPGVRFSGSSLVSSRTVQGGYLDRFPASTYSAYLLARELPDLEDWRMKVGTPQEVVQTIAVGGPRAVFTPGSERVFSLIESHLRGGNTPPQFHARFWEYYGERLLLRGRDGDALSAFTRATEGNESGYYADRAREFLVALQER